MQGRAAASVRARGRVAVGGPGRRPHHVVLRVDHEQRGPAAKADAPAEAGALDRARGRSRSGAWPRAALRAADEGSGYTLAGRETVSISENMSKTAERTLSADGPGRPGRRAVRPRGAGIAGGARQEHGRPAARLPGGARPPHARRREQALLGGSRARVVRGRGHPRLRPSASRAAAPHQAARRKRRDTSASTSARATSAYAWPGPRARSRCGACSRSASRCRSGAGPPARSSSPSSPTTSARRCAGAHARPGSRPSRSTRICARRARRAGSARWGIAPQAWRRCRCRCSISTAWWARSPPPARPSAGPESAWPPSRPRLLAAAHTLSSEVGAEAA